MRITSSVCVSVYLLAVVLCHTVQAKVTKGRRNRQRYNQGQSGKGSGNRNRHNNNNNWYNYNIANSGPLPDEQKLMAALLGNYEPASRPVYNASKIVVVKFGLTLTQISDMDEVNQVVTTNVWLEQEWVDERLTWDPKDYNGLEILRIPCQRIWLPDIVLYNSADDFTEGFMQSKAMVTYEGNVFWPPPAKLRSSCKIDITYFPFDDQNCTMKFGSWTYDGFQVDVTNRSARVDLDNYVYSGEWQLLDISVRRNERHYACCIEPYPDVTFTIVMRRRTLYYLFNIIFPCLWLSILSLLGFWLPPDSGEKITLGITVLLAFSVFMLLIAESMPATSEFVPLIGIYLTVTMAMTSLSIVLTVFVLQLHHVSPNTKPVPLWVRRIVIDVIARLIFMNSHLKLYRKHLAEREERLRQKTQISSLLAATTAPAAVGRTSATQLATSGVTRTPTGSSATRYETSYRMTGDNDRNNCNGRLGYTGSGRKSPMTSSGQSYRPLGGSRNSRYQRYQPAGSESDTETRNVAYDNVSSHLKVIVSQNEQEDEFQDIVHDWRLVAQIMDRFLFWLFLIGSTLSSLTILVFKPMEKPNIPTSS